MANRESTPTREDLLLIPRWARVAFAARCAERVYPVFTEWMKKRWPKELTSQQTEARNAIDIAVASARSGRAVKGRVVSSPLAGSMQMLSSEMMDERATLAYNLATLAGSTVFLTPTQDDAKHVAAIGYRTLFVGSGDDRELLRASMWSDYDRLLELATEESWTDECAVDPDWLGPLWPQGKPKDWPGTHSPSAQLPAMQFEFIIPAGLDATARAEFRSRVAQFYASLSAAHVMMGGTGLRILDEAGAAPTLSLDEAPHDCSPTGSTTPEAVLS